MQNITINGNKTLTNLEREITLNNGSLILMKNHGVVECVYMVVSFRDNKNRYTGDNTAKYCSLVNLDTGNFPFEERCSRMTTVRRVLSHLLRLNDYGNTHCSVTKHGEYDIEVYAKSTYKMDISF